jgi:hypothetical protein
MPEPQTHAARAVAMLPGALWWPYTAGFEGYAIDCPTCGPRAAVTWSADGWRTFVVQCNCPRSPVAWALSMGISPHLLDASDRETTSRFAAETERGEAA